MTAAAWLVDDRRLDRAGLAIVAALAGWTVVASASGGSAAPVVATAAGAAGALVAGRVASRRAAWLMPALVASACGLVLLWASTTGGLAGTPPEGPLRYTNASAALFVQGAIAALMVAAVAVPAPARSAALVAAAAFAAVPFAVRSAAAAAVVVVLLALALAARRMWGARTAVLVLGGAFLAVLTATVLVAAGAPGVATGPVARAVDAGVTQRRVDLWLDAWDLAVEHPVTGVGPGRFALESPTAGGDRDTRAAHNEFLQTGAETGFLGLGLLLLAFVWGFARLRVRADDVAALGAVSLAALGIHASVDYVLRFWPVTLAAAALVGAAQARPGEASRVPAAAGAHREMEAA
jgi:O-antigen ligase